MPTRPRRSGRRSSSRPNASRARGHVLRRIGAVDAQDQPLRARGFQLALARQHGLAQRKRIELRRIDRDRVRGDVPLVPHRAREPAQHAERTRSASARCGSRRRRRRAAPRGSRARSRSGSTDQSSGPTQGMCVKCASAASGCSRADERRRDVEVVVVEEDRGLRLALELLDDGVREVAVDRDVAVVPAPGRDPAPGRACAPRARAGRTRAPGSRSRCSRGRRRQADVRRAGAGSASRRAPSRRPCPPPRLRGPRPRSRSRSR